MVKEGGSEEGGRFVSCGDEWGDERPLMRAGVEVMGQSQRGWSCPTKRARAGDEAPDLRTVEFTLFQL